VFGGTGLYFEHNLGINISGRALETAIFFVYEQLPGTLFLVIITLLLIATFFITSADSATFVLGMQTTNGSLNPPNAVKITWGLMLSASAIVLMASGGLQAMQTAIIVSAFPLAFVLIAMAISMLMSFHAERTPTKTGTEKRVIEEAPESAGQRVMKDEPESAGNRRRKAPAR
jgi:glycine betaine transporter